MSNTRYYYVLQFCIIKLQKQTCQIYYDIYKLHKLILSSLHFSLPFASIFLSFFFIFFYLYVYLYPVYFPVHNISGYIFFLLFQMHILVSVKNLLQLFFAGLSSSSCLLVLISSLQYSTTEHSQINPTQARLNPNKTDLVISSF